MPTMPTTPYLLRGKVQYHSSDVSGAKLWFDDETNPDMQSTMTSSETDSNFTENIGNCSGWSDGDVILVAATHDGRRGQKRVTIDESGHPGREDIGTIDIKAHWGYCG